jgi:hypothetical protein
MTIERQESSGVQVLRWEFWRGLLDRGKAGNLSASSHTFPEQDAVEDQRQMQQLKRAIRSSERQLILLKEEATHSWGWLAALAGSRVPLWGSAVDDVSRLNGN